MPELPEVETIRRHLAPHVEGRTLGALEVLDERWTRPIAGAELAAAVEGRVVERLDAARQVPRLGALRRRLPAPAPAHDRHAADRPAGRAALHAGVDPARRSRPGVHRPAALRHRRAGARRRRARRVLRRAARASSRSTRRSRARTCTRSPGPRARRSRRSCSTRSGSPASGTSTPTRRCSARGSTRCGRRTASPARRRRRCATRSSSRSRSASSPRARASTTSATPTASPARSRTASSCTCARGSRARAAARPCASCAPPGAGRTSVRNASRGLGARLPVSSARRPARSAATSSW